VRQQTEQRLETTASDGGASYMNKYSHGSPEEERGGGESREERDRGRGLANSGVGVEAEE